MKHPVHVPRLEQVGRIMLSAIVSIASITPFAFMAFVAAKGELA